MSSDRTRVLIAGGGVAGLEALLGLSALAPEHVELELLAPADKFVYRPMLVAEPFGVAEAATVELERVVADTGARRHRDSLRAVDPDERRVITDSGGVLAYDCLLIALGARPVDAVPGALTFGGAADRDRFAEILGALGRRGTQRVSFVVPRQATWAIAAYELALLTAAERDTRRLAGVELTLVTHESEPLELFGPAASQRVASRLAEAQVELRPATEVERCDGRRLLTAGGEELAADVVVALPALEVAAIPGLPQRSRGFVATDATMHVAGLEDVWAAGDVTSFPIKQGGLAAQQADVAARAIAVRAGAHLPSQPFHPVLRAALLSGETTDYLRSSLGGAEQAAAATGHSLWWPAGKLAVGYLGAYLSGDARDQALVDLGASQEPDDGDREGDRALELVLAAAHADAADGDYGGALEWIAVAEEVNLALPTRYVSLSDEWRRRVDPAAEPRRAAKRLGGRFDSAAEALSDLQRRVGWLRETEKRTGHEMQEHLERLEAGLEDLEQLSRQTGSLPRQAGERNADRS